MFISLVTGVATFAVPQTVQAEGCTLCLVVEVQPGLTTNFGSKAQNLRFSTLDVYGGLHFPDLFDLRLAAFVSFQEHTEGFKYVVDLGGPDDILVGFHGEIDPPIPFFPIIGLEAVYLKGIPNVTDTVDVGDVKLQGFGLGLTFTYKVYAGLAVGFKAGLKAKLGDADTPLEVASAMSSFQGAASGYLRYRFQVLSL